MIFSFESMKPVIHTTAFIISVRPADLNTFSLHTTHSFKKILRNMADLSMFTLVRRTIDLLPFIAQWFALFLFQLVFIIFFRSLPWVWVWVSMCFYLLHEVFNNKGCLVDNVAEDAAADGSEENPTGETEREAANETMSSNTNRNPWKNPSEKRLVSEFNRST